MLRLQKILITGVLVAALYSMLSCKPKTELYLERGLDILDNKKEVNYQIADSVWIKEIGVIRDQKEKIKTMVFMLNPEAERLDDENIIGLRCWIIDNKGKKRIENWDFKPKLISVNGYNYILNQIDIEENQIKRMKLYLYTLENGKKQRVGQQLELHKVNTYND